MNPNHHYFDGLYQSIWQQIIPEVLTQKEVDHLLRHFKLDQATPVVDLMCGYGRHAIALARNRIPVTAVDNQPNYIRQIEQIQSAEQLPITPVLVNVLDWEPVAGHHMALCMGNSLNFYSPAELPIFLQKVSDSLVEGGYFWINSWSVSEIALRDPMHGQTQTSTVGDFTHTNTFLLRNDPPRLEIQSHILAADGTREERLAIDYLYTIPQLQEMLLAAGLQSITVQSIPGKKDFTEGDPRVYILSKKFRI